MMTYACDVRLLCMMIVFDDGVYDDDYYVYGDDVWLWCVLVMYDGDVLLRCTTVMYDDNAW